MSIEEILLLNILSRMYKPEGGGNGGGNGRGCGCLLGGLLIILFIAFFISNLFEHKTIICIIIASIFALFIIFGFILPKISDFLCELMDRYIYKDEPPEVRKERLETEKLIRQWQKKKYF